jgi:hypothetical protein
VEIIPAPLRIQELGCNYEINKTSSIFINKEDFELRGVANYLKDRIESSVIGSNITIVANSPNKIGIHLILNETYDSTIGDEGYTFSSEKNLIISANTGSQVKVRE